MDGEKAKVFVGASRICYVVPMKLLCERSKYFRSTFAGGFGEASTGMSEPPDIEAETLESVVKRMISGILETPKKGPGGVRSFIDERVEVLPLVRACLAAQFLDVNKLRKAATRVFQEAVLDGQRDEAKVRTRSSATFRGILCTPFSVRHTRTLSSTASQDSHWSWSI